MSDIAFGVIIVAAILALLELEKIRKDMTQVRIMMETDFHNACRALIAIDHRLEKEVSDYHERRLAEMMR